MPALALALALLVGISCAPKGPAQPQTASPQVTEALVLPPNARTLEALRELDRRAEDGDPQMAWLRTHFLLDLFDALRFGAVPGGRELLAAVADRPAASLAGPAATDAIAELLLVEIDRVLEHDRRHADAQYARTLVEFEARPPQQRSELYQRLLELKRIARSSKSLAGNARLRIFGHCRHALEDAASSAGAQRRIALSHCLYALYGADPEPYFDDDPVRRPPPPRAADLLARASTLLTIADHGRLGSALETQRRWLEAFAQAIAKSLPDEPDPQALQVPLSLSAVPYDDQPLLHPGGETSAEKLAELITGPLAADGRGELAVALSSQSPASQLLTAARAAVVAQARSIAPLVAIRQSLDAPEGDYWHEHLEDDSILRLGTLRLSLAPLASRGTAIGAVATSWDPSRASLGLHLLVGAQDWELSSPSGRLARITTSTANRDPAEELRSVLVSVQSAFPDESGLTLVPVGAVSAGALLAAADAASRSAEGTPLFPHLALADVGPKSRPGKTLEARMRVRASARVEIEPEELRGRAPVIRRCFQAILERSPQKQGEVRLLLGADGQVSASGASADLRACAQEALASILQSHKHAAAVVVFRRQP